MKPVPEGAQVPPLEFLGGSTQAVPPLPPVSEAPQTTMLPSCLSAAKAPSVDEMAVKPVPAGPLVPPY